MITISEADFKKGKTPVLIEQNNKKFVLLPWEEFSALEATAYLLTPAANRKHLQNSLDQLNSGETVSIDLDKL